MTPDNFEHIERELSRLAPEKPCLRLDARIGNSLATPHANRFLLAALSAVAAISAAAASLFVMITLLGSNSFAAHPTSSELSSTLAQTRQLLIQLTNH